MSILSKQYVFLGLMMSAFFPYIRTSPFGSDTQPHYYLVFFVALVFFYPKRKSTYLLLLVMFYLVASIVLIFVAGPTEYVVFIVFLLSMLFLSNGLSIATEEILSALRLIAVIYVIGIVIGVVSHDFLDLIVSNRRASDSRGATSFASEPSFLGFIGFCLLVLIDKFSFTLTRTRKMKLMDSLVPWVIILASGSVAAIMPAVVWAGLGSIRNLFRFALLVLSVFVGLYFVATHFPDSRVGGLLLDVRQGIGVILYADLSLANRIARGIAPTYYSFQNFLWPNSLDVLNTVHESLPFKLHSGVTIDRISNFAGILFFSLGLVGLPLVLYIYGQLYIGNSKRICSLFFVNVLFFSILSPSVPFVQVSILLMMLNGRSMSKRVL